MILQTPQQGHPMNTDHHAAAIASNVAAWIGAVSTFFLAVMPILQAAAIVLAATASIFTIRHFHRLAKEKAK
jgi:hypothetical protein